MEANVGMGRDILRYQDVLVERIARRAEVYEIDTATVWDSARAWKKVVAVNTPILQSKVLAKLYEEHPEAVTFAWSQRYGQILVFFRSKPGEGPDVGRIAESFGGGGHKHAAGCTVSAYSWAAFYFARRVALRLGSEERGADRDRLKNQLEVRARTARQLEIERDEARAEVARLTEERDRLLAELENAI